MKKTKWFAGLLACTLFAAQFTSAGVYAEEDALAEPSETITAISWQDAEAEEYAEPETGALQEESENTEEITEGPAEETPQADEADEAQEEQDQEAEAAEETEPDCGKPQDDAATEEPQAPEEEHACPEDGLPEEDDKLEEQAPDKELFEESDEDAHNEDLIGGQEIVHPEIKTDPMRFWLKTGCGFYAGTDGFIYEEMNDEAKTVGRFDKENVIYCLKTEEDGWCYAESGAARGYVRQSDLLSREDSSLRNEIYDIAYRVAVREEMKAEAAEQGISLSEDETEAVLKSMHAPYEKYAGVAMQTVPRGENGAYFAYMASVYSHEAKNKRIACAKDPVAVFEERSEDARVVGTIFAKAPFYIIYDIGNEWSYAEAGNVRGYIRRDLLVPQEELPEDLEVPEDTLTAEEAVSPEENAAFYDTLLFAKDGDPETSVRDAVLTFATQFIGNPYVWGGNSLTEGTDCSGFAKLVYKEFGIGLPRSSRVQAHAGLKIPVEDALPGDLVFYAKDGQIYHVVFYAGDGETIEAQMEETGIIRGHLNEAAAVWALRLITQDNAADILASVVQ